MKNPFIYRILLEKLLFPSNTGISETISSINIKRITISWILMGILSSLIKPISLLISIGITSKWKALKD